MPLKTERKFRKDGLPLSPRAGKPRKAYLETLRDPTSDDWDRMVRACVEAIVMGSKDVLVAFPHVVKLPKGFPLGRWVKEEGMNDYLCVKANKLLEWLNAQGHTDITVRALGAQQIQFSRWLEKIGDDIGID